MKKIHYLYLLLCYSTIFVCSNHKENNLNKSNEKKIITFSFLRENQTHTNINTRLPVDVHGIIDTKNYIIELTVPSLTNLTEMKPSFTGVFSSVWIDGKEQKTNVTSVNFDTNIIYTLKAENNSLVNYLIKIKRERFPNSIPSAYKLEILGSPTIHYYLSANYIYADANFDEEHETSIQWFIGNNLNQYEIIPNEIKRTYKIKQEDLGKYITFRVIVQSKNNDKGLPLYAPPTPIIQNKQDLLIISEVGNSIHSNNNNDYMILFNASNSILSLNSFYIGRDSNCNLSNGWGEFKKLPNINLPPYHYYLISKESNTLNADYVWSGSIDTDYCLIITKSKEKPIHLDDTNIVDFINFGNSSIINNDISILPKLPENEIFYRREKCRHLNRNSNFDDFVKDAAVDGYKPSNINTKSCNPN